MSLTFTIWVKTMSNLTLTDINARRNAKLLFVASGFGIFAPIAISVGAIVGFHLLGDNKSLSSAPVTGFQLGVALGALPAALLMGKFGRRIGSILGAFLSIISGLLAALSIAYESFWFFCISMLLIGIGGAFTHQYRFAATDEGSDDYKPKAIGWVLSGGIIAAILGPQAAIHFRDLFAPIDYAGSMFAGSCLVVISVFALLFLRQTPKTATESKSDESLPIRTTWQLLQSPIFLVSLFCAVSTYALMAFVMTAAPLAMMHHGHSFEDSTNGIMIHVIAMFAPSFITGHLIGYFGKERIVATGMILLAGCAVLSLSGIDLFHFWGSLILLGLGWNLGFIGSTAMLTTAHAPHEKSKVQGIHDFILFSSVAFASLMAGFTLNGLGWSAINIGIFPVVILCLLSLVWLKRYKTA